jgi:hypothetical protein
MKMVAVKLAEYQHFDLYLLISENKAREKSRKKASSRR